MTTIATRKGVVTMDDKFFWKIEAEVKGGKLEDLRTLMQEMVESTEAEPGVMTYEWYLDADNKTLHIFERYADSGAVAAHQEQFNSRFAERFMDVLEMKGMMVYGNPSEPLRAGLEAAGANFMDTLGGFRR
jgi:quinol monooxygenase YgiN